MGWNSWNVFHENINEKQIQEIADAMVSSGLRDAGYIYLNLDDNWMDTKRDAVAPRLVKRGNVLFIEKNGMRFDLTGHQIK